LWQWLRLPERAGSVRSGAWMCDLAQRDVQVPPGWGPGSINWPSAAGGCAAGAVGARAAEILDLERRRSGLAAAAGRGFRLWPSWPELESIGSDQLAAGRAGGVSLGLALASAQVQRPLQLERRSAVCCNWCGAFDPPFRLVAGLIDLRGGALAASERPLASASVDLLGIWRGLPRGSSGHYCRCGGSAALSGPGGRPEDDLASPEREQLFAMTVHCCYLHSYICGRVVTRLTPPMH